MGVFGRVNLREDGKKMRENEEGKLFGECLVGRRRGKKKGEAWAFSLQNEEKIDEGGLIYLLTKKPMCTCTWAFVKYVGFFFFSLNSSFKYLFFVLMKV